MHLPVEYTFIAQRPDFVGAVKATPPTTAFAATGSAFTGSVVTIPHGVWTAPVVSVQAQVTLTVKARTDAVRVRALSYVPAEDAGWLTLSQPSAEAAPETVGLPRTVFVELTDLWRSQTTETHYVLETRGAPVIYGAKLRVVYDLGASRT